MTPTAVFDPFFASPRPQRLQPVASLPIGIGGAVIVDDGSGSLDVQAVAHQR